MSNISALRALAVKMTGKELSEIKGDSNAEIINFIAENYKAEGESFTPASSVTNVSAADATAPSETYTQAEVAAIVTLANANKVAINAIIQALKDAGLMQ